MKLLSFYPSQDIIRDNCDLNYYYNNSSIKPVVLDRGSEIIMINCLNKKSIECTSNDDIPIKFQIIHMS